MLEIVKIASFLCSTQTKLKIVDFVGRSMPIDTGYHFESLKRLGIAGKLVGLVDFGVIFGAINRLNCSLLLRFFSLKNVGFDINDFEK